LTKIDEVPIKRHCTNVVIFMELFVNEGDGRDPSGRVVKFARGGDPLFLLADAEGSTQFASYS
jgi:hypothetical protein